MITRRRLLASAAATPPALALSVGALPDAAALAASAAAGKNILVFITDQERRIQHFPKGWEAENLPGLTRLKQHGVTFENAFANACMCSPSRATLLTGLYPAQHGVKYTLEEDMPAEEYPQVELPTDVDNVATVLTAAGYEVVFKGKWHLSKPIGDDWTPEDLAQYGFGGWNPPDGGANQDIGQAGGGVTDHDGRYMNGDQGVLEFLNSRTPDSPPWCMIVSLVNPHDVLFYPGPPNADPPKYVQAGYLPEDGWFDGDVGLPVTWNEDLSTKPKAQQRFARIFKLAGSPNTREERLGYLNFYANLMKLVDGYLVDILDTLTDTGQLDDTIVIRTSDHGEMGLAHTMQQKNFNFYEETLNIPLVYSNPTLFPAPRRSKQMVSHVDLLPTLASLAGAPASARSRDWRGVDYSRHVLGKSSRPTQDHTVFTYDDIQAGQKSGPYVRPPNRIVAIRERRWKLARYYDAAGQHPDQWEMYDLKKDPLERRNLAHRPARMNRYQRAQFRRLKKRLREIERTTLAPLSG
jgi:arylsulfatase A-like enzyme